MLSQSYWLKLPQETRQKIAQALKINRSGGTVVEGGRVVSDGYTPDDLYEVKVEQLQQFTGSDSTDFYKLFDLVVKMIESPMEAVHVAAQDYLDKQIVKEFAKEVQEIKKEEESQPKKRGRQAKKV